jgi:hypothetical protein
MLILLLRKLWIAPPPLDTVRNLADANQNSLWEKTEIKTENENFEMNI